MAKGEEHANEGANESWTLGPGPNDASYVANRFTLGVLTLVETSRHKKDGTQDQHGNHASGQKTAAVTSHEIHHVGSRKWLIVRPKRIAGTPSSNRAVAREPNSVVSRLLPVQAIS